MDCFYSIKRMLNTVSTMCTVSKKTSVPYCSAIAPKSKRLIEPLPRFQTSSQVHAIDPEVYLNTTFLETSRFTKQKIVACSLRMNQNSVNWSICFSIHSDVGLQPDNRFRPDGIFGKGALSRPFVNSGATTLTHPGL